MKRCLMALPQLVCRMRFAQVFVLVSLPSWRHITDAAFLRANVADNVQAESALQADLQADLSTLQADLQRNLALTNGATKSHILTRDGKADLMASNAILDTGLHEDLATETWRSDNDFFNAKDGPTLGSDPVKMDGRLSQVMNMESIEDFENRQKPPFISIPGQNKGLHTEQQRKGVAGIFDQSPNDFRDCMLVHQFAEPLSVTDTLRLDDGEEGELYNGDEPASEEMILVRPGALYDGATGNGTELHISTSMYANLDGISNPVQVIPHGGIAKWNSKSKVPIAGFLCMTQDESDSAPVLNSFPTPCMPTSLDEAGNAMDPTIDNFEIFIGHARVSFASKDEAAKFCIALTKTIATDLGTLVWDMDKLANVNISGIGFEISRSRPVGGDTEKEFAVAANDSAPAAKAALLSKVAAASRPSSKVGRKTERQLDRHVGMQGLEHNPLLTSPNLMSFVSRVAVRSSPEGWTKGVKKLLVLVMDWKEGDDSMAPYSHQMAGAVEHYRDNIFPVVKRKFEEMSYGQFSVDVTVVPEVVRYTRARNSLSAKMPFPGLYDLARVALQGHASLGGQYLFRDYDLVFVIHPQTTPCGTKGLAWVGSRGAICNGCETLSDNFKIMVAVHELGHNLGLSHASSTMLEYGNPFDWMGNYPDVVGLHYGVGYKYDLGWIPPESVYEVTDATLGSLNDLITLSAYDSLHAPQKGQIVGVKITLSALADDLYLSFRSTAAASKRGLFIVHQDRTHANSKLVDAGCHTISEQDAHLRKGWTFMDEYEQVVVKVVSESPEFLKVHLYKTPSGGAGPIRARALFTDGQTKCPVTCQDADLLISHTCAYFKEKGYCTHGKVNLHGQHLLIGSQICPQTCGLCEQIIANTPPERSKSACVDKSVKLSGMGCPEIASRELCSQKTTSGTEVGRDLCPASCGWCPEISSTGTTANDADPTPAREIGLPCPASCAAPTCVAGTAENGGQALTGQTCTSSCSAPFGGLRYCGSGGSYSGKGSVGCGGCKAPVCPAACMAPTCQPGGADNGGLPLNGQACNNRCSPSYGGTRYCGAGSEYMGDGSIDCSSCWGSAATLVAQPVSMPLLKVGATPEAAPVLPVQQHTKLTVVDPVCEDDEQWRDPRGMDCRAYRRTIKTQKLPAHIVCRKHLGGMGSKFCRATCGSCKRGSNDIKDDTPGCSDNVCIGPWQKRYARCYRCNDFPKGCTDPKTKTMFESECPKTCGICKAPENKPLVLKPATSGSNCKDTDDRWCKDLGMGYCSESAFARKCPHTCELCAPAGAKVDGCIDLFSTFTCSRYASYGWCEREDTKASVRLRCPMTCGSCGVLSTTPETVPLPVMGPVSHNGATPRQSFVFASFALGIFVFARTVRDDY